MVGALRCMDLGSATELLKAIIPVAALIAYIGPAKAPEKGPCPDCSCPHCELRCPQIPSCPGCPESVCGSLTCTGSLATSSWSQVASSFLVGCLAGLGVAIALYWLFASRPSSEAAPSAPRSGTPERAAKQEASRVTVRAPIEAGAGSVVAVTPSTRTR